MESECSRRLSRERVPSGKIVTLSPRSPLRNLHEKKSLIPQKVAASDKNFFRAISAPRPTRHQAPPPANPLRDIRPIADSGHICQCPPIIPGWPDAEVRVAAITATNFWPVVSRPFVFRIVSTKGQTAEEAEVLAAGLFTFVVRPGREDADTKALADQLTAQGGPILGALVDLSGGGSMFVQIAAVLMQEGSL